MKRFLFAVLYVFFSSNLFATTYIIETIGFDFSPQNIDANVGDSIHFDLGQSHNAVEVSESTYNSNGTTSNGGFILPFGADTTIVLDSAGIIFYICSPHVNFDMKGTITVGFGCTDPTACNYDSLAVIDTNCLYNTASTTDVTECDSYTWNGTTYTTSGSYT